MGIARLVAILALTMAVVGLPTGGPLTYARGSASTGSATAVQQSRIATLARVPPPTGRRAPQAHLPFAGPLLLGTRNARIHARHLPRLSVGNAIGFVPMRVVGEKGSMTHGRRKHILREIGRHPGIGFSELANRVGVANGDLTYHLRRLEASGAIVSLRTVGRRHFILPDASGNPKVLLLTRRKRQILELARISPGLTETEVAETLGVNAGTVSYHIQGLHALGLVRMVRDHRVQRLYTDGP